MKWYLCEYRHHKHRTKEAADNCHYCIRAHKNWLKRIEKDRLDWEEEKRKIKNTDNYSITKLRFLKLSHSKRWDLVKILKFVKWHCEHCGKIVDNGKKPQRQFMGSLHCGNCEGLLTRRTGGGQSDPCCWFPKFTKKK